MSSVRESLSYTLSTNLRNRRQYPETNDFVVELPMPVRNVVSLSLQRMEMNLSQTLVREGVNDTLRFREGLRLGGKSADDTAFELSVEGGGPSQRVSLPSFMNPILTISGTGPIVITTYRDVGLPVGALTVADMDALGIEMYLFGATAASGGTPGWLSLRRAAEATPVSVTGANELRIETAFFDTSDTSGGGILPDNKSGDACRGLFLVCEPLSVGAVAAVLSRHASASGVACTYDEASDRFRLSHDGGRALSVAEAGGATVAGPSALVTLGFFHGQAGEALTARSAPPFYEARLHPGNYDLSGMAKNVCSAINPGALTPFSTYGIEEAAREASKLGVALFVVERGGGALAHVEVPASYVFVSPRQLAGYLSAAHEATFAPSADAAAVDDVADTVTVPAAFYAALRTGDSVTLETTGTLPGGLAAATSYSVAKAGSDQIQLFEGHTLGAPVDIVGVGTGTHTLTLERRSPVNVSYSGGSFTFSAASAFRLICIPSQVAAYAAARGLTTHSAAASRQLREMLGLGSARNHRAEASLSTTPEQPWPSQPRTWAPVMASTAGAVDPAGGYGFPDIHEEPQTSGHAWYDPERMYPRGRFTLSTQPDRPGHLRIGTVTTSLSLTFSTYALASGVVTASSLDKRYGAAASALTGHRVHWMLPIGEPLVAGGGAALLPLRASENAVELLQAQTVPVASGKILTLQLRPAAPTPERFSIPRDAGTAGYRLGIARAYGHASHHLIEQQFDLRPNHYFMVALKNMPYTLPQNTVVVPSGDPDASSGRQRVSTLEVLARCVVAAPFVFDRGQSHSVTFSQPTTVARIGLKFLDEGGQGLLQTNRQEISFTVGFVRKVL